MNTIKVFKKLWTPEPLVILERNAKSGKPTFALGWGETFPEPIYLDMPLRELRKITVTAARYHRRAGWAMYDRTAWKRALKMAIRTLYELSELPSLPMSWEDRRYYAERVWRAPALGEDVIAQLRNAQLDLSDDD